MSASFVFEDNDGVQIVLATDGVEYGLRACIIRNISDIADLSKTYSSSIIMTAYKPRAVTGGGEYRLCIVCVICLR